MNWFGFLVLLCGFGFAQVLTQNAIPNPATAGSIQPNWTTTSDGGPLLSWVEPGKDGAYSLRYALRRGSGWSEVRTVAANRRFFRHPAEAPELLSLKDGTLIAHWVENGKEDSDAEYIFVSSSRDGIHWTAPLMAHHDRGPVQHGLASMVASGPSEASILWLQALKGEDGPVSLMRTVVGADGKEVKEEEVDQDVCSCCPTSVVKTAKGLLVAYRGHTPQNIRDIAVRTLENGRWSAPKILNPDKWRISACPVNAASAAAKDDRVAIAWYTGRNDSPRVQITFSSDDGATFAKPVQVNTTKTIGYVSTALNGDRGALVSWIEEGDKTSRVMVRLVLPSGVVGPPLQIAQGSKQSLGYPRLLRSGSDTWIAWGDTKAGPRTAYLK
jgi:hypothetical protein